jgi:hypothetical protein
MLSPVHIVDLLKATGFNKSPKRATNCLQLVESNMLKVTSCSFWRLVAFNMLLSTCCWLQEATCCWQLVECCSFWRQVVINMLMLCSTCWWQLVAEPFFQVHEYSKTTRDLYCWWWANQNSARFGWMNYTVIGLLMFGVNNLFPQHIEVLCVVCGNYSLVTSTLWCWNE